MRRSPCFRNRCNQLSESGSSDLTCRGVLQPSFFCRRSRLSSYCWRCHFFIFWVTDFWIRNTVRTRSKASPSRIIGRCWRPVLSSNLCKDFAVVGPDDRRGVGFWLCLGSFHLAAATVARAVRQPRGISTAGEHRGQLLRLDGDSGQQRHYQSPASDARRANSPVKLIYTDAAIVVGLVHITLPFMILSILAALERIDEFLPEAASTLGANPIQVLRHVILPLALPGFAAGRRWSFALACRLTSHLPS